MSIKKLVTKDGSFLIVIAQCEDHNMYFVYDTDSKDEMKELMGLPVEQLHVACKVEDHQHHIEIRIEHSGSCIMKTTDMDYDPQFSNSLQITSFYDMLSSCYDDAQQDFLF